MMLRAPVLLLLLLLLVALTSACPDAGCTEFNGTYGMVRDAAWDRPQYELSVSLWVLSAAGGEQRVFDVELADASLLGAPLGVAPLLPAGEWVHVVWRSSPLVYEVLLNGTAVNVSAAGPVMTQGWTRILASAPTRVHIASQFAGALDALRGWRRVLTDAEVDALRLGSQLCLDCGRNFVSAPGAPSCHCDASIATNFAAYSDTLCECAPGYQQVGTECYRCPAGYYCPWAVEIHPCREGTYTQSGATSGYDCICVAGTYSPTGTGGVCVGCPEDSYCIEGQAFACDGGLVSPPNSTGPGACACPPGTGYELGTGLDVPEAGTCVPCAAGQFAAGGSLSACQPCPAGEYSTPGAAECAICAAGFFGEAHECAVCPLNAYCPTASVTPELCPDGTVGLIQGAATLGEGCGCLSGIGAFPACECPAGSVASLCTCTSGTHEVAGVCEPCPAGFWCPGGSALNACPLANQATAGSAGGVGDCLCAPGFTLSAGACAPCGQDTYKDWIGDDACTACPIYTSSAGVSGGSSVSVCTCNSGYFAPVLGHLCYQCSQGFYCTNSEQHQCPWRTSTVSLSSSSPADCLCLPGYYKPSGACAECPRGTYKPSIGNGDCLPCPPNTYNEQTAQVALSACIACPSGTIYTEGGATHVNLCQECPAGYYEIFSELQDIAVCESCPPHMTSPPQSTSAANCSCNAGFEPDAGACSPCPPGSFKAAGGNLSCAACLPGTFSTAAGAVQCDPCPHGTFLGAGGGDTIANCSLCPTDAWHTLTGATSAASCECNPGFFEAGGCTPCDSAHFCPGGGQHTPCPDHSASEPPRAAAADCVCTAGFYQWEGGCIPCAPNSFKDSAGNGACTACPTGTTTVTPVPTNADECVCPPGEQKNGGGLCEKCPIAYFNTRYGGACEPCSNNSVTLRKGAKSAADCHCTAGYWENAPGECEVCPAGAFCPLGDAKRSCPPGMTSASGSATIESCVCVAGLYLWDSSCEACPQDHFCPPGQNDATPCPNGTVTVAGQTSYDSVASCVCPAGAYGPGGSAGNCTACPVGKTAPPGTPGAGGCKCDVGSGDDGGGGCAPCGPDTHWADGACVPCGPGRTGRGGPEPCVCADGTYETASGACAVCPNAAYCVNGSIAGECRGAWETVTDPATVGCSCVAGAFNGGNSSMVACQLCPEGSRCPGDGQKYACTGATWTVGQGAQECLCAPGHAPVNGTCEPCPPGAFKEATGSHGCTVCAGGRTTAGNASATASACACVPGEFSPDGRDQSWISGLNQTQPLALGDYLQGWLVLQGGGAYNAETGAVELLPVAEQRAELAKDFFF